MATKQLKFGKKLREEIKRGIDITVEAVQTTLGPEGKVVAIVKPNYILTTKDGVTVAENIELENYQKIGNESVKEAARKTNSQGGDGTTVTAILVQAMVGAGFSAVDSGISPVSLVRGIKKAV